MIVRNIQQKKKQESELIIMGKVYAATDFHGCGSPAKKLLAYLKEDDKLYYLGDSTDRGNDGVELFEILTSDPRVIYLMGNHEQLMLEGLKEVKKGSFGSNFRSWISNGGQHTFKDLDSKENAKKVDNIIKKIWDMSIKEEYHSPKGHIVILEHAGFSLGCEDYRFHDPLWDREHFYDNWSDAPEDQNVYLVHGHTPVQYLQFHYGYRDQPPMSEKEMELKYTWDKVSTDYWQPEIIRYCDGHKFDIDLCTIASNRVALLDLDTFEVTYFEGECDKKK